MNNRGYTTVFFTLMISVLLLFTFTALEVTRIHTGRIKQNSCVHSMHSSILADYNRVLFERYHLLFIDPTYGTESEAVMEEKIEDYLDASLNNEKGNKIYTFTVQDIALIDEKDILWQDMRQVKEQVAEYEKTAGVLNRVKELTEKLEGKENDIDHAVSETETNGIELNLSEDNVSDGAADESGQEESPEIEDPRETMSDALKFGTLSFLMPNCTVSKEEQDFGNSPSAKYEDEQEEFKDNGFKDFTLFKNFLSKSAENKHSNKLAQQAAFVDYTSSSFSHEGETKPDSVMQCEVEYILKGRTSDYDNLQAVIDELTWLRLPVNYAYLLSDSEKKSEALTVAAGICTAAGAPEMMEIVKYLLLGCWAYGETLCEMRTLLEGEEIAYVKTKENWNTDLKNLTAPLEIKKVENGINYEEYLMILLAGKGGTALNACYARMLDLMELNIKRDYPHFHITDCIAEMTVQGKITVNPLFDKTGSTEIYEYCFEEVVAY